MKPAVVDAASPFLTHTECWCTLRATKNRNQVIILLTDSLPVIDGAGWVLSFSSGDACFWKWLQSRFGRGWGLLLIPPPLILTNSTPLPPFNVSLLLFFIYFPFLLPSSAFRSCLFPFVSISFIFLLCFLSSSVFIFLFPFHLLFCSLSFFPSLFYSFLLSLYPVLFSSVLYSSYLFSVFIPYLFSFSSVFFPSIIISRILSYLMFFSPLFIFLCMFFRSIFL